MFQIYHRYYTHRTLGAHITYSAIYGYYTIFPAIQNRVLFLFTLHFVGIPGYMTACIYRLQTNILTLYTVYIWGTCISMYIIVIYIRWLAILLHTSLNENQVPADLFFIIIWIKNVKASSSFVYSMEYYTFS